MLRQKKHQTITPRTTAPFAMALVLAFAVVLSGCASNNEYLTSAYIDPSRYDLYNCLQLRTARRSAATRAAEVQGLINKAQTGFAGSLVSEVAYRNEYISARAQYKLADQVWQRNRCESERLPPETLPGGTIAGTPLREPPPLETNEQQRQPESSIYRSSPDR